MLCKMPTSYDSRPRVMEFMQAVEIVNEIPYLLMLERLRPTQNASALFFTAIKSPKRFKTDKMLVIFGQHT